MKNAILFTALTALVAVEARPFKHRHNKHGGCKNLTKTVTVTVPAGGATDQPAPTEASAVTSAAAVPSSAAAEASAVNSAEAAPSAAAPVEPSAAYSAEPSASAAYSAEASPSAVESAEASPSAVNSAEPSPSAVNSAEPAPSAPAAASSAEASSAAAPSASAAGVEAPAKENAYGGGGGSPDQGWTSTWGWTSTYGSPQATPEAGGNKYGSDSQVQQQAPAPAQSQEAQVSAAPAQSAEPQVQDTKPSASAPYKPPTPTESGTEFLQTHTDTSATGGQYSQKEIDAASKRDAGDPVPTYDINLRVKENPTEDDFKGSSAVSQSILKFHNDLRANFGAAPLTWNENMARKAKEDWNDCQWEHKGSDNLHQFSASWADASEAGGQTCKAWADEWTQYPFDNPAAEAYSHFTQMVWKGHKEVGCGWTFDCPPEGSMKRKLMFRCIYTEGGNMGGGEKPGEFYEENVGRCTVCK